MFLPDGNVSLKCEAQPKPVNTNGVEIITALRVGTVNDLKKSPARKCAYGLRSWKIEWREIHYYILLLR